MRIGPCPIQPYLHKIMKILFGGGAGGVLYNFSIHDSSFENMPLLLLFDFSRLISIM
jgi:hypothetical protein